MTADTGQDVSRAANARTRVLLAAAVSLALALGATWPIFTHFDHWGRGDWDQHFFYQAVPRRTLLEYGQWPLWNPWYCGGMVMLANPQSRFLSPTFLFTLLFGPVAGVKIEIPIHYALCVAGGIALGRTLGLATAGAVMAGAVYALCTMFSMGLAEGMTWLMACAYVPWALTFYLRSLRTDSLASSFRAAVLCAASLVLMFFNGGAYPLAWACFAMALLALADAAEQVHRGLPFSRRRSAALRQSSMRGAGCPRSNGGCPLPRRSFRQEPRGKISLAVRPLAVLASVAALALLLGAVKFIPSIAYMQAHPRRPLDESGYSLSGLAQSLLFEPEGIDGTPPDRNSFWRGGTWTREENAIYVGFVPLVLACFGLLRGWRRHWKLFGITVILVWVSFGYLVPISLWEELRHYPVFGSMRVAQRARIIGMLLVALFAGMGLDAIARCRKVGLLAAGVVLAFSLGDLVVVNSRLLSRAFVVPPARAKRQLPYHQISKLDDVDASRYVDNLAPLAERTLSMLYPAFLCNVGTIRALESAATRRRPVPSNRPHYRGEVFVLDGEGRAEVLDWTPNRVTVTVEAKTPAHVALNQNYVRGWLATGGSSPAKSVSAFVGCAVPAGRATVTFSYRPMSAIWGAGVSLCTLAALAIGWLWTRKWGVR